MRLHVRVQRTDRAGGFLVCCCSHRHREIEYRYTGMQASMMLAYMPAQPYVAVLFLGLQARRT
jgi:hypothetical protein